MKRFISCFFLSVLAVLAFSFSAYAQNAAPLLPATPDGWEVSVSDLNETCVAAYIHPDTESRIEVYKRVLPRSTQAETFFSAFSEQLILNGFSATQEKRTRVFSLINGKTRSGEYYEFEYQNTDVQLAIAMLMFTVQKGSQSIAYIVVAYYTKGSNKNLAMDAFEAFVQNSIEEKAN